ncbi:MAG: hypothetical protein AABX23_02005 [Nanoarchaeota archaeon]
MVHKKYTYKNGKRFGPYYYETRRINGKVVTTYLGSGLRNNDKILLKGFLIFAIIFLAFYFFSFSFTGNVSLDIDKNYNFGESINGVLRFDLFHGELIPSNSLVLVAYGNTSKIFNLSELVSDELVYGEFYAEGVSLSGSGEGYGVPGKVIEYPFVDFDFSIIKIEENVGSESFNSDESEIIPEEQTNEEIQQTGDGSTSESSPEEPETEAESTESTEESSLESSDSIITGDAISDLKIINGQTSKENAFSYVLSDSETASLIEGSVSYDGNSLNDEDVEFKIKNDELIVSTDYYIEREGFGEDYISDESEEIIIDMGALELIADKEDKLTISLIYQGNVIVEASEDITILNEELFEAEVIESDLDIAILNESIINQTLTNETIIENMTEINKTFFNETSVDVKTKQFTAVIGQPVRWTKTVSLELNDSLNLTIEVPASAENITINKITSDLNESHEISGIAETSISNLFVGINGEVTADISAEKDANLDSFFSKILKFFSITGNVVEELGVDVQEISIELQQSDLGVEVEYYTDAPAVKENILDFTQKTLHVSSPADVHYENVLVFTNLSDNLELKDSSSIVIEWVENNSILEVFSINDSNNDGNYDYIQWIAPHLSNQTFNIIVIIDAQHLNETYGFISNIYNETRELDNIWSESIPDGHYVRVTFETNLTSINDITIYSRATNGTNISDIIINVFEKDSNESLARFYNLTENEYNKIYLNNLGDRNQDTFDLLVTGGEVEFDHIIDPSTALNGFLGDVGLAPLTSESYVMTYLNRTGNTVQFQIMNTDGTTILQPVTIATGSGDGYNRTNNVTRVAVASINSTFFVIGWTNTSAEWRAGFKTDGTYYFSPVTTDGSIGTALHEIALTAFNTTLIAYCYVDSTEGDLDMIRFDAQTGTLIGTETDVNAAVVPEGGLQDRADCDVVNATSLVAVDYDAGGDDDAIYHLVDHAGTEVVTDTAIDSAVGTAAQVASATIDNDKYVLAWYDQGEQDITIAINDLAGNSILSATDVDTAVGSSSRLSIATVFNKSTNSDNFVVAYFNQSAGDIVAVAYNGSGTMVTQNFIVESFANTAPALYYAVGKNPATGMSLCNETWVITYTNSSDKSITKTYWLNGTLWDGNCPFTPVFGLFNETILNNSAYVNNAVYAFNITITDSNGTAGFEFNGTNRSVSNLSATMFNSTIANIAAGTYSYYWWSYGPGSTYNISGTRNYVIARNTSQLNLTLNGTQSNITISSGGSILLNGTLILGDPGGNLQLYNNGTLINQRPTEVSNLTSFSGIGIYNITVSYAQTQNYSQSLINYNVTVISGDSAPYNGTALILNSTLGLNRTLEDLNVRTTLLDLDNNTMNVTVRWYNNSILHLTQAYNLSYSNGTTFIATLDDGNTTKGHNWSVGLTIYDSLNNFNVNSSNLTILNSLPNVTLISPANDSLSYNTSDQTFYFAHSDDDLDEITGLQFNLSINSLCEDSQYNGQNIESLGAVSQHSISVSVSCFSESYLWSLRALGSGANGTYAPYYTITFEQDSPPSIALNQPLNDSNFSFGSSLSFNWTATDDHSSTMSCNLTIDNLVNSSNINSPSGSMVNLSVVGFSSGTHGWNVTCADTTQNIATSQTRTFRINNIPYNGTALILNSTLGLNRTLEDLNVRTTLLDLNNDTMNVTVRWYNNSILHLTQAYNLSYSNGTTFIATLDDGNTTKGHNWSVGLTIYDPLNNFNVNSSNLTILNSLPNVSLIAPANGSSTINRTNQNFTWVASDDDGDAIKNYTVNISLIAQSTCVDSNYNGGTGYEFGNSLSFTLLDLGNPLNCLFDNLDSYRWSVSASDGSFGSYSDPFNLKVQAYINIVMNISLIEFGNLGYLKNNDTSDNFPKPFILINEGNVLNDIDVEGTSLWQSVTNPTDNYKFKFDNVTTNGISENGSFNWTETIIGYSNIPLVADDISDLVDLKYADTTDSVEVDINVTVPSSDGPGVKSSTITFTIELGSGDTY